MISFLSKISRLGVTPDLPVSFAKRIILTNCLGIMFTINMSVSAVIFLVFDWPYFALFTFFFVLTELTWPFLNHYKKYTLSRLGMLVSSNLLGFCVSVLLPDTGHNRGFYVMAGLPVLLFDMKEKKSIALGLLLPVILYPVSEWFQYQLPGYGISLNLDSTATTIIYYSIGIIYVVLIFLMFLFLSIESQRAEAKLLNANNELEDQRARSFSSAKFAALGEMAGGIAHEINNPMTVINLNAQKLEHVFRDENIQNQHATDSLNAIMSTIKRVAKIIDSMRTFSRDAAKDSFEKECPNKIVEDTLTFCSERFRAHGIDLNVKFSETQHSIHCKSIQISQVLLNLLNNSFDAVDTLDKKWVEIAVSFDRPVRKAYITVTDSGSGIPEELHEKIFQPFFTTKPVGKGTGLGLSLSRKIIQDHNGSLHYDPHSENTRFVIILPTNVNA